MRKTIKANFINGSLVPLEPCDINDGDEVLVQVHVPTPNGAASKPGIRQSDIVDKPAEANDQSSEDEPSNPKGHPVLEIVKRAKENLRDFEQPDELPTDAAKNYKHYMYGWPKESER